MLSSLPAYQPTSPDRRERERGAERRRAARRQQSGRSRATSKPQGKRKKLNVETRANPAKGFFTFLLGVVVIGLLATTTVGRYAELVQLGYQVQQKQAEVKQAEAYNQALISEIAAISDLNRIEHLAKTELGMVEPPEYRPVEIQVEAYVEKPLTVSSLQSTRLALLKPDTEPSTVVLASAAGEDLLKHIVQIKDNVLNWFLKLPWTVARSDS